jgi:hypothetical protein
VRIEGVSFQINWKQFKKGHSFFLPCLNCYTTTDMVKKVTKRLKYNVVTKCVIEDGIRGVRVWRI